MIPFPELPAIGLQPLGYTGAAQFVAFWWEPMVGAFAWADDTGDSAVSQGNNRYWLEEIQPRASQTSTSAGRISASMS
jgi:hypothetical protein